MAFRTPNYLKSMVSRLRGSYTFTTSTPPNTKAAYAAPIPMAPDVGPSQDAKLPRRSKGDLVPVYVALGMIVTSMSFGIYTGLLQVKYAPNVFVKKSRRETLPEVVEPEHVVDESTKFINKSFFRKVAHIQESNRQQVMSDPIRGDVFARLQPRAETLKSVGVDPKLN
ncbi:unnamed protein product [Ilex paraguariensis]|uniref:Uncharacterized protein n=1 Tax=Ilex paraguariensis TaxID=185542 RepID=A0ABC8T802_9AQUA